MMTDAALRDVFQTHRTIAVVGLSPKSDRASYQVAQFLQSKGFRIVPVYPRDGLILDEQVYARLEDIPFPVDVVDVFRRAEDTPVVAEGAVRIGAKGLWLQLGIENEVARSIAETGGLWVVEDRCMKIEYQRLMP
jgi:predicted CoA-binding protein